MGQTLTQIADTLHRANNKVQLIYGFNAGGKTRLSRAFKELIDPDEDDRGDAYQSKVLYYNAFTEDLFYWDNDLEGDTFRKLMIRPNAYTQSALVDLGLDGLIVTTFQRFTNTKLSPRFNEEYKTKDKNSIDVTIPAFSEVTFSLESGDDKVVDNLKISKGEESNFIWSVFYCLLDQVISTRNVTNVAERETDIFNALEYVFVDDPVSSLDDNHLIELAVNLAELIRSSNSGLKFIITTHNPLFYNVLHSELNKPRSYMLKRLEDGSCSLDEKRGASNSSFSYHLHLKHTLELAIAAGRIEKYHFTLLRNLYEKTAGFLGYKEWGDLLDTAPGEKQAYLKRIIHFSSHAKLSSEEVREPTEPEKQTVKLLLENLINNYSYWQPGEQEQPNA